MKAGVTGEMQMLLEVLLGETREKHLVSPVLLVSNLQPSASPSLRSQSARELGKCPL